MLFSGEERFQESTVSDVTPDFAPQSSTLSSVGGPKILESWYQGTPCDKPLSPVDLSPRKSSELDMIKRRQPSWSFSKAPKNLDENSSRMVPTSPIHVPQPSIISERTQSPVKYFGSSERSKVKRPVSNTSISVEAADRAFKVILPTSTAPKFSASDRKQKLKPSTTPGPGQYKPTAPQARTTTIKSRTKIFGCNVGEDSPGPNSYILPSTLIKKSHNVRSNGFGSQTSQANEETSCAEPAKVPCPPCRIKSSKPSSTTRERNIFQASDLINLKHENAGDKATVHEHFTRKDVKEARSLFSTLMSRSSAIIQNIQSNAIEFNCRDAPSHEIAKSCSDHNEEIENSSDTPAKNSIAPNQQADEGTKYAVGEKVLCNFCNHGQWCPGTVTEVAPDNLYSVLYDDGDLEENRPSAAIMKIPDEKRTIDFASFRVGDTILGNYDEKGIWFEGIVKSVFVDEDSNEMLCDVEYCDGDVEYDIPGKNIIHAKINVTLAI